MKRFIPRLPRIKCIQCGRKQGSMVCKKCREKNIEVIEGRQETLEELEE